MALAAFLAAYHQGGLGDCRNRAAAVHHLEGTAGALIWVATAVRMAVSWAVQAGSYMLGRRILHLGSGHHSQHRRSPVHIPLHLAHKRRDPPQVMGGPHHAVSKAAAAELVAKAADTPW